MDLYIPEDAIPKEGEVSFDPIEPGRYDASIFKAEETTFKSGTEGIKVDFILLGGEYDKRHVFENYVLTDSCMWKFAHLLKATGYDLSNGVIKGFNPADLVGSKVRIKVGTKSYNGKESNIVDFVDPPPGGPEPRKQTGFVEI